MQNNQTHSDEIDLVDLVRSLWDGKWLVIGVMCVTLMLAAAYLVLVPKTYTASFEISPLPAAQLGIYNELNATQLMAVNKQELLSLFIDDIKSYNGIQSFIKTYGYLEQQKDETDPEFAFRQRAAVYDFALVSPASKKGEGAQPNWSLNITTQNPKIASQIVADALALSNQNVNEQLVKVFQLRSERYARKNKFAIEDLELKTQRALAVYNMRTEAKLVGLAENAQIARAINLKDGTLFNNASVMISSSQEGPLYLRGYLSIEKEIEVLQSRENFASFVDELPAIEDAILTLLQDQTLTRADEIFSKTPIGTDQFLTAVYDLALIDYKSKTKDTLVLALAIVLGGMLGVFVLLIRNALINKD